MTLLFPRLGSPELEPYEAPFGRMMLAFARATAALIELVIQVQGKGEAEAVRFVTTAGTKDLPKKLRRLFKNKLAKDQDAKLSRAAAEYKAVADERHHLVHGDWWFNVFENGVLTIRRTREKKKKNKTVLFIEHRVVASAADLDDWTARLDAVADIFDDLELQCRPLPSQS
jgi:hypothetical protein